MSVRIVKNGVEYIVADASDNSGGSITFNKTTKNKIY